MENVGTNLRKPYVRRESIPRNPQNVIVSGETVWELEKLIPYDMLFVETRKLERKLDDQKQAEGYFNAGNDLEAANKSGNVEFAHVLEHAILATIDSHLSPHQLSEGHTYIVGINAEKSKLPEYDPTIPGSKIAHLEEIELRLAPTIPADLQKPYVDSVLQQMKTQFLKSGKLDLENVKL